MLDVRFEFPLKQIEMIEVSITSIRGCSKSFMCTRLFDQNVERITPDNAFGRLIRAQGLVIAFHAARMSR